MMYPVLVLAECRPTLVVMAARKKTIYTIGHSTHSTREFIAMLRSFGIEMLVDVRHYPGSRYCPQFGKTRLKNNLARHEIKYVHLLSLGGRRPVIKGMEANLAWRSAAFRGYADYMQSLEFREGLKELMELSKKKTVAIMCAEAVPWRCHRSLISDALIVRDYEVLDIFSKSKCKKHTLTSFAKVTRKKVTYPKPTKEVGD